MKLHNRNGISFAALLIACISYLFSGETQAQENLLVQDQFRLYKNYDRYRYMPRLPHGRENPKPLPKTEEKVEGDPKVLVDELRGIFFVDHPDKVRKTSEVTDIRGVQVEATSNLRIIQSPSYQKIPNSYIGNPVSVYELNKLVRDTIVYYRRCDQPVVDISIPEQDITDGVVQIVVTEGRLGKVCVKGSCYFDNQVLADQLQFCPGCPIYESHLQRELRWLYRNPFRTVDLELTPGKERGETDVIFNVKDKNPWRFYTGYEDTGTQATGLERLFYGFTWNNAFGKDHTFGYQYTTHPDFSRFHAHSAFYSMALENRDILSVYGAFADYKASIPLIGEDPGQSWQVLTRWNRELEPIGNYEHGIMAGFDYKSVKGTVDFFPGFFLGSDFDIAQLMIGYNGRHTDCTGSFNIGADGYWGPGGFTSNNTTSSFQGTRPGASEEYYYTRAFFERRYWLPECCEFVLRGTGQLAGGKLMPTEQLGLGGYNSIRGYDQYSTVGDAGFFLNVEFWTPERLIPLCGTCGKLRGLVFYDYGTAHNRISDIGDPNIVASSVGVGFRYEIDPQFHIRFDYGHQMKNEIINTDYNDRVHLGVVLAY